MQQSRNENICIRLSKKDITNLNQVCQHRFYFSHLEHLSYNNTNEILAKNISDNNKYVTPQLLANRLV
jgi:hypothetical protein